MFYLCPKSPTEARETFLSSVCSYRLWPRFIKQKKGQIVHMYAVCPSEAEMQTEKNVVGSIKTLNVQLF